MSNPISLQQGLQQLTEQKIQETSSNVQNQPKVEDSNKFNNYMELLNQANKNSLLDDTNKQVRDEANNSIRKLIDSIK